MNRTNEMHGMQQVAFFSYRYVPQIFVFVYALEMLYNFSKLQIPYIWWSSYVVIFSNFCI